MKKAGDLYTPFKDAIVSAPTPTTRDGSSFGTPFKNAKEATDDKFGGGVQFDKAGSESGKTTN